MNNPSDPKDFSAIYDDAWNRYDFIIKLFQAGRDRIHRLKALKLAGLKEGDIVLDLCCGTGLSIDATESIIGPSGKIIAVDASEKMLALAKKRAERKKWNNITFIRSEIENLTISQPVDFALFAFCWYEPVLCTGWVNKIKTFLKKDTGTICFIDHKMPDNWFRTIASPLVWLLLKLINETYGIKELLKWDPHQEIATLLIDPIYKTYYLDCILTISGKPKM